MKARTLEKGQALILIIFGIVVLIGLTGLAIDGGNAYSDRRNVQNAADTAALAAALAKINDDTYTYFAGAALDRAASNGYADTDPTSGSTTAAVNVEIYDPPISGQYSCDNIPSTCDEYIQVIITSNIKTFFAPVLGIPQMTNKVQAIARSKPGDPNTNPLYPGSAVFSTYTGTCKGNKNPGLGVSGSSSLQIWGGGMSASSTDPDCTRFQGGQTQIKKAESGTTCGDIVTAANDGTFKGITFPDKCGTIKTNIAASSIPPNINFICGSVKTDGTPGTYNGTFPPSGVKTLSPGLYCLNGDFVMNAHDKLTADGVTIYLKGTNSSIMWNGNMDMTLKAALPSNNTALGNGAIPGLVIYAPKENQNTMTLNGNGNVVLSGTQLTAGADCNYLGSGQVQKQWIQFICSTWQMNGDAQAEIEYDPSVLYIPPVDMPQVSLVQ